MCTQVLCYVGLKRAVKIANSIWRNLDTRVWLATIERIKNDVLEKGWDERKHSFVMSYETRQIDASTLMLPLIGFISPNDKRTLATIQAVKKHLSVGPLIYRYRINDGLEGKEGAFVLCSFWMVTCQAKAGKVGEAREISKNSSDMLTTLDCTPKKLIRPPE